MPTRDMNRLHSEGFNYQFSYRSENRAKELASEMRGKGFYTRIIDTGTQYEVWVKHKEKKGVRKDSMKQKVIKNRRELKVANLEHLARGLGARYLEVIESHRAGEYIAKQWRRKLPASGGIFIDLK